MRGNRETTFQLGELVTLKRGYDLPESSRTPGNYPIISSSGVSGSHNEYRVEGPGVVTGRYGTLGEVFYIANRFWPLNTSLYVHDFKGNSPRFISYYLRIVLSGNFNAAGAVPGVNRNVLHKLGVPKPPRAQNKVAAILSAYDDLIDNNRRGIALLEKMAEEIYREWFVRMRFPGHAQVKVAKGVPEGWGVIRLSDMVDFQCGYPFKSETYSPAGRYGIVTIKNVQDGFFIPECTDYIEEVPSSMKPHCYLQTGDMLMSLTGHVGRVCHVGGDNLVLNQRVTKLVPRLPHSSQFVFWTFNNKSMIQIIENLSLGSTAQLNLSSILLGKQKMVRPSLELMKKFEETTLPILKIKLSLFQQSIILKAMRERLLPRLMSGKLDVEHLNIEFPPGMVTEVEAASSL